jgi:hypothetical protein
MHALTPAWCLRLGNYAADAGGTSIDRPLCVAREQAHLPVKTTRETGSNSALHARQAAAPLRDVLLLRLYLCIKHNVYVQRITSGRRRRKVHCRRRVCG